jgi:hypothetical protein
VPRVPRNRREAQGRDVKRTAFAKRRCHRRLVAGCDVLRIRFGWVVWANRGFRVQYLRAPITWADGDAVLDRGAVIVCSRGGSWLPTPRLALNIAAAADQEDTT